MFDNLILNEQQILDITKRLGKQITEVLKKEDKLPVIVGVLNGAVPFMTDLLKNIDTTVLVDYIRVKSYSGLECTGKIQLLKDLSFDCEGRTVIIVEDIVDTGNSMLYLINHIKAHNPKKVLVCTLFNKSEARKVPVDIDFIGYELTGSPFLLGYGLDYKEACRNLPYVVGATKEDIEQLDKILANEKL